MLSVATLVFSLVSLQGVNDFPKTPDHQWAYDGLDLIGQWGLIPDVLEEKKTVRDYQSRMGFATACKLAAPEFRQLELTDDWIAYSIGRLPKGRYCNGPPDLPEWWHFRFYRREVPLISAFLRRGAVEFAPELRVLGVPPADIDRDVTVAYSGYGRLRFQPVGSALKQFSDVPSGHWAAGAILDLRKVGVLGGYPDGSFRGQW